MRGKGGRTSQASIRTDGEQAGNGSRYTRRCFVKGVGAAGTVGVLDRLAGTARPDRLTSAVQSPLSEVWSTNNPETVVDYFIEDGLVYVATGLSVRTLDIDTGQEVSRVVLDERIRPHGLAKDGKWLAVALESKRLQILDVNSFSTQVTIPYTGEARGIAANNGAVYVGRTEGFASRNLPDGDVRWRHDFSVNSPVWQTSEGIWINKSGKEVMLSEADGKVLWKNGFGGRKYFEGDWLRDGDHFWGFVETESHIVTGSPGGGYHVADKFTGEIAWSQRGGGHVNRPAVSSDRVVHQYDTELHFREFDTGEKVVSVPFRPNAKGITFHGGSLLGFGTWNNKDTHVATGLDPSSGGIRWKEETDGPIGLLTTLSPRVYGVNLKTNEIVAYRLDGSSSGDSTGGSDSDKGSGSTTPTATGTQTSIETQTPTETRVVGKENNQKGMDILPVALGLLGLGGAGGAGAWWMINSDDDSPDGGPSGGGTVGETGVTTSSEAPPSDQQGDINFPDSGATAMTARDNPTETPFDHLNSRHIPEKIPDAPDVSVDYDTVTDEEPIGGGGNADVVKATLPTDDGDVTLAIKRPRMAGTIQTDAVKRILAEAETWDKLDGHDHIVGVVDYGSEPLPWIAMEYMDGGHLGQRAGQMDTPQALWTTITVSEAVHYAHYRRGVAHLDLKPANVLFRTVDDAWDVPKVGDWGLSKHLINQSKSIEGMSPQYAAPEQFDERYGATDTSTDIYQLGATFYTLFAGQPPFGDDPRKAMRKVLDEEPTPPSQIADVPNGLDTILLTAMAKEKDERYDNVAYFRDALQELFETS